jgi:hypothetical protein
MKLVQENLNDILKPKSKNQIITDINKYFNYNDLKNELNEYPKLNEYFKNFIFEKYLYLNNTYKLFDLTDEAIEIIKNGTKNLQKPLNKLFAVNPGFHMQGLNGFLWKILNGLNENIKSTHKATVFERIYEGNDYLFYSSFNTRDFALFIIPDNLLDKYFKIDEFK